ncbi:MAG: DUF1364 family protein [Candidatus Micrarchaeota archaeon]|nr:DUF1364 family protein [Candidatus Micrarchaeota archaeon]
MIRSRAITQSAEHEACCICHSNGTTVFAHSNHAMHGKGKGIKSHDIFGAYLCYKCHARYDGGELPTMVFFKAMAETQLKLVEAGLIKIKGVEPEDASSKILPRLLC